MTLDPVTFEVIRHRLWAINDDQATMAARLSGSPIVYDAYDFNAALVTPDGRGLYTGVYIMHHGATIDFFVRRVVAEWPAAELREGDLFFTNDPWWGALHANDGVLATPIFWQDRLVLWSAIVMHDNDVGSPVPGSWATGARDRFAEAPLVPALKLGEAFAPRPDLERALLRNSRTPDLNALNMRARVAALRSTAQRVRELIERYGLDVFLDAQEGIVDYVEQMLRRRLGELPNGTWSAQTRHDHDGISNEIYTIRCRLTKDDDGLTFDLRGTSPQAPGPINCARAALEAAVLGVVLSFLCYDLPWTLGGVNRVVNIVSDTGTVNNAVSPAPISMASIMATLSTQDAVAGALAEMLECSEKYRDEAQATWSPGVCTGSFAGRSRGGEYSVTPIGNSFGGGGGARTFADGIDTGGVLHSMGSRIPNTETLESRSPILQLFRRQLRDGGGPGRFRGGTGIEFAATPYKADGATVLNTLSCGVSLPTGLGLSGGAPGAAVSNVVLRGSDIHQLFASGRLPRSAKELTARAVEPQEAKQLSTLVDGDVLLGVVPSGAGYGDPLRRAPELVQRDVRRGLVSPEMARAVYGVVVEDGRVREAATRQLREEVRARRLREGRLSEGLGRNDAPVPPADEPVNADEILHPVLDTVQAVRRGTARLLRCTVCHHSLGAYGDDYKRSALIRELPLTALTPVNAHCLLERFVARELCCPGCGTAIALDVQERDEPLLEGGRLSG